MRFYQPFRKGSRILVLSSPATPARSPSTLSVHTLFADHLFSLPTHFIRRVGCALSEIKAQRYATLCFTLILQVGVNPAPVAAFKELYIFSRDCLTIGISVAAALPQERVRCAVGGAKRVRCLPWLSERLTSSCLDLLYAVAFSTRE